MQLAKGKASSFDPKQPKKLTVFVATSFPAWQQGCIEAVGKEYETTGTIDTKSLAKSIDKADIKRAMPFVQLLKKRIDAGESATEVFARKLPFDEVSTLNEIVPGLKQAVVKLEDVIIVTVEAGSEGGQVGKAASPGHPAFLFENIS